MQHIADWTQESTYEETINLLKAFALSHAREGGAEGERIASCITSNQFSPLCDLTLDYSKQSAYHAGNCRQAIAFFSKLEPLEIGQDKLKNALIKWRAGEELCRKTNEILRLRSRGLFNFSPEVESIIYRAQSKIARVLGPVPSFDELKLRFGPGATTLTKKRNASIVEKLQHRLSCSEDLLPYASRILEELPALVELHEIPETVYFDEDGVERARVSVDLTNDLLDFVPKNAKTYRSITKCGSLNSLVQLAFGDYMTKRLAAFGVDLTDQGANQRLALEGSMYGNFATLDLSNASDTVAIETVYLLLPVDWALALNSCRSSQVEYKGESITLEKFSSMGNGYTFPLESLIFWALSSCASTSGFSSVYGDDIVVRTEDVASVKNILHCLGFELNEAKSYWEGPFRESCGADYIRGIDIRPYYQKELVTPAGLFRLHNFYVRNGDLERAALVREQINPSLRIYGPDGFGDGHLLGDWIPKMHKKHRTHGYGGVVFDTFSLKTRKDLRALRPGDRILPLYSIYVREDGEECLADIDPEGKPLAVNCFLRLFRRNAARVLGEPLPERKSPVDGVVRKTPSYPGTEGVELAA